MKVTKKKATKKMHLYKVTVNNHCIAVYTNKYDAQRHAIQYAMGVDAADVYVEYSYTEVVK
jgi:hypothetical protein